MKGNNDEKKGWKQKWLHQTTSVSDTNGKMKNGNFPMRIRAILVAIISLVAHRRHCKEKRRALNWRPPGKGLP